MSDYFITGTDTGVGKTWATLALMQAMQDKGKIVVGMKPVASGCQRTREGLRSDDGTRILKQSKRTLDYKTVNPFAFEPKVAPHIAANIAGVTIDLEKIADQFSTLKRYADHVIVEGIGGWDVPLGENIMLTDMVERLDLDVILVVGLRLGCINHALSAKKRIQADGAKLHGWISSQLDPDYLCLRETIATLQTLINVPLLGRLPNMEQFDVKSAASQLTL